MATMLEEVSDLRHMVLQNKGFNSMATSSEVNTVWIGLMDIVPVIGTVKEAVELVLAIYEGNEVVVKEKEKAIENIVQESFIKNFTCPDKSAKAEAAAPAFSELKNVSEATKENIANCMAKVSKNGSKLTRAEQNEREKKVESIKEDMLKKIQVIKPNFYQDLKEELARSKKDEHVFNNGILKFHSKVLNTFIKKLSIYTFRSYDQLIDRLGKNTLPIDTAREVQNNMKVEFKHDEFYVNANAVLYGTYSQTLSDAMLDVLKYINPDDVGQEKTDRVNFVIDKMNEYEIYVDHMAKEKWINNKHRRQERFDDVKGKVANMYSTDRGLNWCFDILHEVELLINSRQ